MDFSVRKGQAECVSFYSKIKDHFTIGKYTDVKITCHDGRVFRCHRVILAAACQYFDAMFGGNFRESFCTDVDLHPHIDGVTFELLLEYMYSGDVSFVNDQNVYDLLRASDILVLDSVESACVHHLSQRGVPTDSALEIFLYVCATRKKTLMSTTGRFILKHFRGTIFPQIPFEELRILLSYFRPFSLNDEQTMLKDILKWVLSRLAENSRESQKSSFVALAQNCSFEYVTPEFASNYFDTNTNDCQEDERRSCDDEPSTWAADCVVNEGCGLSLNMYTYSRKFSQRILLELFTLRKNNAQWNSRVLYYPSAMYFVDKMRSTVVNDRLYYFKFRSLSDLGYDTITVASIFGSSPTADLCVNYESLKFPPVTMSSSCHVCSDGKNSIYAFAFNTCKPLCVYDCRLSQWSKIDGFGQFYPRAMTWFDRQLYLFGGESAGVGANMVRAYDRRSGRFEKFPNREPNYSCTKVECCSHRERIYLVDRCTSPFKMEIFDPAAGKWTSVVKSNYQTRKFDCRLVSFDGLLWTLYCDDGGTIGVSNYDSYLQSWTDVEIDGLHPGLNLLDAVVYKPL